jgi:hypothetical protein
MSMLELAFTSASLMVNGSNSATVQAGQAVTFAAVVKADIPGTQANAMLQLMQETASGEFVDTSYSVHTDANGHASFVPVQFTANEVGQTLSFQYRVYNPSYSAILSNVVTVTVLAAPAGGVGVGGGVAVNYVPLAVVGLAGLAAVAYFALKK